MHLIPILIQMRLIRCCALFGVSEYLTSVAGPCDSKIIWCEAANDC